MIECNFYYRDKSAGHNKNKATTMLHVLPSVGDTLNLVNSTSLKPAIVDEIVHHVDISNKSHTANIYYKDLYDD